MIIKEALAFDDVLLAPCYTEVRSRSIPDLTSHVAGLRLKTPIISSPMDTVTEADMAIVLGKMGGMGIIHRFMSPAEQTDNLRAIEREERSSESTIPKVFAIGVGKEELSRFKEVYHSVPVDAVAIDVANGHSSYMRDMIHQVRDIAPDIQIIAGNVATGEGFMHLAESGANAVRIGIGGGCFVPGSMVLTKDGYKPIESVSIGDLVLTHTGSWKSVINTMTFDRDEEIVSINDINCTKNHEFYVVNKADASLITENNIHQYAFWIEAENLNKEDHLLIELD